jgi:hypothetical protein
MSVQLELFEPATEEWLQEKRINEIAESQDRLRKGLFSRFHEQGKLIVSLTRKIDYLESEIIQLRLSMIERVK